MSPSLLPQISPMFNIWSSDQKENDKALLARQSICKPFHQPVVASQMPLVVEPRPQPLKSSGTVAMASPQPADPAPTLKRARADDLVEAHDPRPAKKVALPADSSAAPQQESRFDPQPKAPDMQRTQEAIESQFSLEILLKHDELRLVNQELAKCQVALEQLRRCHLIPYPVNMPTPHDMLTTASGTGPVLQSKKGGKVPEWAPPFGVTDGPYARHYAKWLIPDPKFDGILPPTMVPADGSRLRTSMDSRSTRNALSDTNSAQAKGRPSRVGAGQKLQALSQGYPQPKGQAGPCVLKRADGKTVKLVCNDCHRENFSSTQGFINHCRIAHKKEFKSHEEAAVHCGHPIDPPAESPAQIPGAPRQEKSVPAPTAVPAPAPAPVQHMTPPTSAVGGHVHPFARSNAMGESEACFSVVRRIEESMKLFRQGQLPGVDAIPGEAQSFARTPISARPSSGSFQPSSDSPHLSRLLQSRGFNGDLSQLVVDAKTKVDLSDGYYLIDEADDSDASPTPTANGASDELPSGAPRMRVPVGSSMAPVAVTGRPQSNKGVDQNVPYSTPLPTPLPRSMPNSRPSALAEDDMMVVDLSPNTVTSNNAPSLVSDDGEYDDSVADSDSDTEAHNRLDEQSVADVEEMDLDSDHTSAHRRGSNGAGSMRFRKDDKKHVTFVRPVKQNLDIVDQKHSQKSASDA